MSEMIITTPTSEAPGPIDVDAPTQERRERRTFPIRLLLLGEDGGYRPVTSPGFDRIAQAESWLDANAEAGTYLMARVVEAQKVHPRRRESVSWETTPR